ncbi:hypothetical protein BDZ89DRAFT_1060679 [Hymenopellis radicata]|nr:hypothetical protein BDZ89DRAFT_1060679 [Hymenopellis radicata]
MLLSLPQELVENVLFHYACADDDGRTCSLRPLELTCRALRRVILLSNDLAARVFRAKFATSRHAGMERLTAAEWRYQLALYEGALACVQKRPVIDGNSSHSQNMAGETMSFEELLWKLYVMCHDDDESGANRLQLNSVGTYDWIQDLILNRLNDHSANGWPADNTTNTLLLWIFWFLTTKERIHLEPPNISDAIVKLILPFVPGRRQPFLLPLSSQVVLSRRRLNQIHYLSVDTPHGSFPKYRQNLSKWNHVFFGRRMNLTEPLITIAAKLCYFDSHDLPPTRAQAGPNVAGRGGGTRIGCSFSRAEWERLRNCGDPWQGAPHTNIYTPGTMSGLWVGRMSIPVEPRLAEILSTPELNPAMSEMFLGMITAPMYMRIEELVSRCGAPVLPCTTRSAPVIDTDGDEDEDMLRSTFDDGMFNAFLPNGFMFRDRRDGLKEPYTYQRLPVAHDSETCLGCVAREEETTRRMMDGSLESDGDDLCREVLPPCTGVQDVVLRGTTDSRHAQAWNDYTYYGRVRQWDGMITLMRIGGPTSLFLYGYITGDGRGLVGNWRIGTGEVGLPSYEA